MDKKIPKTFNLSVEFDKKFENIGNSGFKKGVCRIAYAGKNRNYSDISKESFEKALNSLALIPIVGNFKEGNFHGHDVAIELEGNDIAFKTLTTPIGVVPQTYNAEWVDIEDENGNIKKYLQCDVIFWYERNKEAVQFIIDNGYVGQSMEITNISGEWTKDGYFKIEDFEFSALCLLGTSDDSDKNVEPCFEDAEVTISQFALNKDEFKSNFTLMMEELKSAYIDIEKEIPSSSENLKTIEFSATYRQKREALQNALDPKIEKDDDGNIIYEEYYWVEDFDDEYVFVERSIWTPDDYERKYGRFTYAFDEENVTATISGEFEEMVLVWLTVEENKKLQEERDNYTNLQSEFEEYKNNYSIPNDEVEKLKEFKSDILEQQRKMQEEEIFNKYDEVLDVEDKTYKEIKENKSNYSIEQLEEKLAVLFARKQIHFSSNENKKIIKLGGDSGNNGEVNPYGDLFEKHLINKEEE